MQKATIPYLAPLPQLAAGLVQGATRRVLHKMVAQAVLAVALAVLVLLRELEARATRHLPLHLKATMAEQISALLRLVRQAAVAVRLRLAALEQVRLPAAVATELRHLFPVEVSLTRAVVVVDVCLPEPLETEAPEAVAMVATERLALLERSILEAVAEVVALKQAELVTAAQAAPAS